MEYLRNMFKNKDRPVKFNLILMATLGVILLIFSRSFLNDSESNANSLHNSYEPLHIQETRGSSFEENLEKRLISLLSQVEGVGEVDVMISLIHSSEIILAEDVRMEEHTTKEADAEGGTREVISKNTNSQAIILQGPGGLQQPLILREIDPKIEGVIIVAQGGDDIFVKEAIVNAARTVLGVAPHKVQVLKMK